MTLTPGEVGPDVLSRGQVSGQTGLVLNPDHRVAPLSVPPPQASRTEQELQRELDTLRGQCQTQALAGAELRTRLESLQAEVVAAAFL